MYGVSSTCSEDETDQILSKYLKLSKLSYFDPSERIRRIFEGNGQSLPQGKPTCGESPRQKVKDCSDESQTVLIEVWNMDQATFLSYEERPYDQVAAMLKRFGSKFEPKLEFILIPQSGEFHRASIVRGLCPGSSGTFDNPLFKVVKLSKHKLVLVEYKWKGERNAIFSLT